MAPDLHEDEEDGQKAGRGGGDAYAQVSAQEKGANLGHPACSRAEAYDDSEKPSDQQNQQWAGADNTEKQRHERYGHQPDRFDGCTPQLPKGLQDDGDDDGLDTVEKARDRRQRTVVDVCPRQNSDHDGSGKNEACARDQQARPSAALTADVNHELGRSRTGNEVAGAEMVEEFSLANPAATCNHFLLQHRDVSGGATEGRGTKFQEEPASSHNEVR